MLRSASFRIPSRITKLIEKGEGADLDFKKEVSNIHKIAKAIVSFANTRGGTLLIGVNDDKMVSGVGAEEERHMLEKAAGFFTKPALEIQIKEYYLGKRSLLEVIIPEGRNKPYYALGEDEKWWAYIRVNDQSLLASKVVLDVLKRASKDQNTVIRYSSNEKVLLEYLRENKRITLKQYCKLLNISRWRAQRILVNLISIGVIRVHTTEKQDYYTLS
ncbi:MAG: ATP-binding protein [Bacteroidia bacterium]|nr:ATP-binding protein [Bacteroidia bacterium]